MNQPLETTQNFGGTSQMLSTVETASSAIVAQAKAMIESRYIMAMRNPRNWDQVRIDLLEECKRPAFANNPSSYYNKPIGKGVEGLGIRFTEVALRCMRNVLIETNMIFEDNYKEIHRVSVTDLESNVTYPLDVKVTKTVERSRPNDDGTFISQRKNSFNKITYTVQAQDDDLLNKRGAMISKAIRTLGNRIIPGDLQDEATAIIKKIRLDGAAKDPKSERNRIIDAFAGLGIKATDLVAYLGHQIEQCSPTQLVDLRGIYGAIKDGEATWKTVMENKNENEKIADELSAEQIVEKITKCKSRKELDSLSDLIKKTKPSDRKVINAAWTKQSESFVAGNKKTTRDYEAEIKACTDEDQLNKLLDEMPDSEQIEYAALIEEQSMSFEKE